MQSTLVEYGEMKRVEVEQKQLKEERVQTEREKREAYFRANFKFGSTTVLKHNGVFFFYGDIRHCGKEAIFFNARKIKSMMETNGHTMGHMNYNDPPTFYSKWDWDRMEHERKGCYTDDLFMFDGDEIREVDVLTENDFTGIKAVQYTIQEL